MVGNIRLWLCASLSADCSDVDGLSNGAAFSVKSGFRTFYYSSQYFISPL